MDDNEETHKLFMDVNAVAEMLCVKKNTIYSWISYKQLPANLYRKLGRKPIFIRKDVLDWFLNGAKLEKRQVK